MSSITPGVRQPLQKVVDADPRYRVLEGAPSLQSAKRCERSSS